MLTPEQAAELRARHDRFSAWVDTRRGRNGWASYHPDDVPAELRGVALSNDETAALELHEFERDAPEHVFCYVTRKPGEAWQCRTFAGGSYGTVAVGYAYRVPGFYGRPSTRRSVTLNAINGWVYFGTFYESSGDYARLKRSTKRWREA
jgi:hypothetical protein